jgi:NAD(P)-dependent dehydrogenase (short-subunit alcohol dehydrogenase family)
MSTKIAVISGTSSGIGLLSAVELARSGYRVIAGMRDLARRDPLEKAASNAGVRPYIDIRRLDITDLELIPSFIENIVREHGRINVLVNNAGFAVAGFAEDLELGEIRTNFETNFFGTVAMTQAVLPVMRQQGFGQIIMVSSISGLHGSMALSSYSASKHALEGWSESLRLELNPLGIKVVLVEPGAYRTDIWDRNARLGRRAFDGSSQNRERGAKMKEAVQKLPKGDPIEVARAILKIAQDPNPRLRYIVGKDARMQLWLKRVLPWKWHERLIARMLKVD